MQEDKTPIESKMELQKVRCRVGAHPNSVLKFFWKIAVPLVQRETGI